MNVRAPNDLGAVDPDVARLVAQEADRRARTIDLIASESEPSAPVLEALGSVFAAKTAEGYPGRRYHRGTEFADEVEQLAIDRAKALFGAGHANVQPSSGVNANLAVYRALLKPGDAVLALQLAHGGHLSHGDPASITGAVYRFEHYGVRADTETIDLDEVRDLALRHRPRLIVTGGSSYPRAIDYAAFAAIAAEVESKLLVDMAHVAGLVAAGELPSPVPHADAVTFTTYKTMLGPHGGVILSTADLARKIDRAIFPGTQGAPDFGRITAKAVCLGIAASDGFRETQRRIRANATALATALAGYGDRLVSGGTDNHMVLVDLRHRGVTGDVAEVALETAAILCNRNVIPFDPGTPDRPSGLRFGTTSPAQRGMGPSEMTEIAALIDKALQAPDPAAVRPRAEALAARFGAGPAQ
ncbi:MAG: serine hydroxymethyltransferase [Chloroflexi bacterium]|nr:serine hydroxymethyltransferase [Chloroflexota bacterium]